MTMKLKRGWGEGSVYKRTDGRWYGSVSLGAILVNGKERRVRRTASGATKTEVQQKLAHLRNERRGEPKQTLAAWLEQWLCIMQERVRPSTHALYAHIVRHHIVPAIGYVQLAKVSPAIVQQFYSDLAARGASARTRKHIHANLYSALKAAVRLELVARNAAEAVDPPRYTAPDVRPLTVEQVRSLVEAAKETSPRVHAMVLLAVRTGLRQGELFALRRSDLDVPGAALSVRGTMQPDGTIAEPKTARGRRRVSISPEVLAVVREHLRATPTAQSELLFRSAEGTPLRKSNFIRRDWAPLLKRAGLPPTKWHALRHTHATLLLAQGVHPKVVQERLGHSSYDMTMDVYSSVVPGMDRAAADGLDDLFA